MGWCAVADDRRFVGGDNYILDDISGFKIRSSRARIIPGGITGGAAVSPSRWEPQQPQDFVTGVADEMVADLIRSRQENRFVIVGTEVVAPSARLSDQITVASARGFTLGASVQIMLDSGENFRTVIAGISGRTFTLLSGLPASVGTLYGDPIENAVLLLSHGSVNIGVFILDTADHDILDLNFLAESGPFILDATGADILDEGTLT